MLEKTRGIVIHQTKYSDESIIVDIFTESHGVLCFMVKTARSKRSNARSILMRPLNILEIDYDYRPHQTFQRIREVHVAIPFVSLPYDPAKETVALFLSEFLYHSLKHEIRNEELFIFLCESLQWLDQDQRGTANFHLIFLIRLTRFLGFWPYVEKGESGSLFDLKDAVMTSLPPLHGYYLKADEAAMLPLLLRLNFNTMHLLRLNRMQRGRILEVLITYYRLHVPEFPELKSLNVLREILS